MTTFALGDGLEMRPLEERDAGELYLAVDRNRERLRAWLSWVDLTLGPEDCLAFIRDACKRRAAGEEELHLAIREHGRLVGGTGYRRVDRVNRSTSIGYWLDERAVGRGIVTRTTRALVDHLIRRMGLHRVEIRCAVQNTRSCAVPQRLGFTREGVLREAEWAAGRFHDVMVWSILAHEWK